LFKTEIQRWFQNGSFEMQFNLRVGIQFNFCLKVKFRFCFKMKFHATQECPTDAERVQSLERFAIGPDQTVGDTEDLDRLTSIFQACQYDVKTRYAGL
jgi:hypothetical protein